MYLARPLFFLIIVILTVTNHSFAADPAGCLSTMEKQLVDQINLYRNQNGLPDVPVSFSLTLVAQWHVIDLFENNPATGSDHGYQCNMHSWSNQKPNLWNAVCYTGDHMYASGMWNKPREITNNVFSGNGYENAFWTSGTITASIILNGWKNSPNHNAVILEQGMWFGQNWPAMGVGIYNGFAVLWFGDKADPQGIVSPCSKKGGRISTLPFINTLLLKKKPCSACHP